MTFIKRLLFPVSIASARLELKTRWWHRALVVTFFLLFLPMLIAAAFFTARMAVREHEASYLSCVERDPLLTKDGANAVIASPWPDRVKAYDSFFSSKSDEDFRVAMQGVNLPKQVKADLWNAKYASTHQAPPPISPEELVKYNYVAVLGQRVIEFPSTMTNKEVNAEMAKKFDGAEKGWMPVDVPDGFIVTKLEDGTELYLHDANLTAAEVKRRVAIFRASPLPELLPAHFFDRRPIPIPKGAKIGPPLKTPSSFIPDKPPDVENLEDVSNPFQSTGDALDEMFDIAAAQIQRHSVRASDEWKSCRALSPSQRKHAVAIIAVLSVLAGSYLLQGLYRALLYIIFGL